MSLQQVWDKVEANIHNIPLDKVINALQYCLSINGIHPIHCAMTHLRISTILISCDSSSMKQYISMIEDHLSKALIFFSSCKADISWIFLTYYHQLLFYEKIQKLESLQLLIQVSMIESKNHKSWNILFSAFLTRFVTLCMLPSNLAISIIEKHKAISDTKIELYITFLKCQIYYHMKNIFCLEANLSELQSLLDKNHDKETPIFQLYIDIYSVLLLLSKDQTFKCSIHIQRINQMINCLPQPFNILSWITSENNPSMPPLYLFRSPQELDSTIHYINYLYLRKNDRFNALKHLLICKPSPWTFYEHVQYELMYGDPNHARKLLYQLIWNLYISKDMDDWKLGICYAMASLSSILNTKDIIMWWRIVKELAPDHYISTISQIQTLFKAPSIQEFHVNTIELANNTLNIEQYPLISSLISWMEAIMHYKEKNIQLTKTKLLYILRTMNQSTQCIVLQSFALAFIACIYTDLQPLQALKMSQTSHTLISEQLQGKSIPQLRSFLTILQRIHNRASQRQNCQPNLYRDTIII